MDNMITAHHRRRAGCGSRGIRPCWRPRVSPSINIPTLCYLKDLNEIGACRMCVVDYRRPRPAGRLRAARVTEGMDVKTNTPKPCARRPQDHCWSCC